MLLQCRALTEVLQQMLMVSIKGTCPTLVRFKLNVIIICGTFSFGGVCAVTKFKY